MLCVGVRSTDGRQFLKTPEAKNEFRYSGAFETMMMEFLANPKEIEPFLQGVLPKNQSGAPAPAST